MSEAKIQNLEIAFEVMKNQVTNIKEGVERIESKLDKYIDTAEKRFAGKWVEKVAVGSIIALITALIALILKS